MVLLAPSAHAAAADKPRLDRTVRYLQDVQHKDGGFGEHGSDPGFSTWAAYALAAASINPRDQRKPGGVDVYTYLTGHTDELEQTTDFARVVLVASAAGASPQRFGGLDPLRRMLAHQRPDGSFPQLPGDPGAVNASAYAVLALASIDDGDLDPARKVTESQLHRGARRALDWLVTSQDADGSWANHNSDLTASVIEALNAAGRRRTPAQGRALRFLRGRQNPDGGLGQNTAGEPSNTSSTSWVARALFAARIDPRTWKAGPSAKTPLDYLASMQRKDGSVRSSATDDGYPVWMTSYTVPALAGVSLPLATVERAAAKQPKGDKKPTKTEGEDAGQPGAGGTADGGDGQVTAGGGGEGAPLFSRPRPGSRGSKAGGERDTRQPSRAQGEGEGAVAGQSVAGKLVGRGKLAATGNGQVLGTAPGLRTAAAGGHAPPWLTGAIGAGLLLSALGGIHLERRPRRRQGL